MDKNEIVVHHVHFQLNGVNGWVVVAPKLPMWVFYMSQRIAYTSMQGALKKHVHSIMVQQSLVSSWQG